MHSDPNIIVQTYDPNRDGHISGTSDNVVLITVEPELTPIPDNAIPHVGKFQPNRAQRRAAKKIRRSHRMPKDLR